MTINFGSFSGHEDFPPHTVELSQTLDTPDWTYKPANTGRLFCDRFMRSFVHSGFDTASIVHQYGHDMAQIGSGAPSYTAPADLVGLYVRITISQAGYANPNDPPNDFADIVWHGYILEEFHNRGGSELVPDPTQPPDPPPPDVQVIKVGAQSFRCVGLEWFLDRVQIDGSVYYDDRKTEKFDRIKRPLNFNGGTSGQIDIDYEKRENKHTLKPPAPNEYPVFESGFDKSLTEAWTAADIVDYLLYWFGPRDPNGDQMPCAYELSNESIFNLQQYEPAYLSQSGTLYHALRSLMPATRGLCAWWRYDPTVNVMFLEVDTFATDNVTLPTGGTLLANSQKHDWPGDSELRMEDPVLRSSSNRRYTSVKARGARRRAVFTVSIAAANMVENWSTTEQTDYDSGALTFDSLYTTTYASLTPDQKKNRNDSMRRSDHYKNVYATFKMVDDWDGKSNNGEAESGGAQPGDPDFLEYSCPTFSESGAIIGGEAVRVAGMRLQNRLPLKFGWEYETSDTEQAPDVVTPVKRTLSDITDYIPPFAIAPTNTEKTKYQYLDKMGQANYEDGTPTGITTYTSYHMIMSQQEPAFTLRSQAVNHTLAGSGWSGEPSNNSGEIDYNDVRVTLCGEWDAFLESEVPQNPGTVGAALEPLVIDMGNTYRFDYLAANTIIRLNNGTPVYAAGGILRDDSKELGDIATIAWEWYKKQRTILQVRMKEIRNAVDLGYMITTFGTGASQVVLNTVVSSITYDVLQNTMEIKTDLVEINRTAFEQRERKR